MTEEELTPIEIERGQELNRQIANREITLFNLRAKDQRILALYQRAIFQRADARQRKFPPITSIARPDDKVLSVKHPKSEGATPPF